MRPSLSDPAPKSIEQAENELFIYSHPQAGETPAETGVTDTATTETPPENEPDDEEPSYSEILRRRFEAQRERIAQQLAIIRDIRQTIARLQRLLEKPPTPE